MRRVSVDLELSAQSGTSRVVALTVHIPRALPENHGVPARQDQWFRIYLSARSVRIDLEFVSYPGAGAVESLSVHTIRRAVLGTIPYNEIVARGVDCHGGVLLV